MRRAGRGLAAALLVAGALAWPARAQREFARVTSRALPEGLAADDALSCDDDGDGRADLLVVGHVEGKDFARVALVYRAGPDGAWGEPERLDLTPDVVAWTAADVHPDPGDELVLLTATGVFAWRASAEQEQRFQRLLSCELLWQLPDPTSAFVFPSLARDVDGDGLADLVVPEPGGYRVAFQRRAQGGVAFEPVREVRVPAEPGDALEGGPRVSLTLSIGGEQEVEVGRALLAVDESVPAPQWSDWDGDGRLDLLAQTARGLHLWRQAAPTELARDPTATFLLPVVADRKRRLDASYGARLLDLDGDGRGDCSIFAGDPRAADVRTQVLAFRSRGGPRAPAGGMRDPFGEKGVPQDLLVLGGFLAVADFVDLDGDGRPELLAHTVRPDLIDTLRSAASETIDAELYVYRNDPERFARKPALTWRYTLPLEAFEPTVRAIGDASGDGLSDLIVRVQPDRVRLLMLRPQRGEWSLLEKPLWELALHEDARLRLLEVPGRAVHDLAILEPRRVLRARFGR